MRHPVILAGGGGTRLWPASCRATPKQFLALGAAAGESLLAATARRLTDACGSNNVAVVTAAEQAEQVQRALPALPPHRIIAEPAARNTAAALGLAAVYLQHWDDDAILGAIPADQHIADETAFAAAVDHAFRVAEQADVIVTIGIVPTRPETGYGYLQVGAKRPDGAESVVRFVEKPDATTASRYLAAGDYLWNGGMFFVRASRLLRDIETHMPETHRGLAQIASALATRPDEAQAVCDRVYPTLPRISIDYGVMEKASDVVTIRGDFGWNDVGSWSSLSDYRSADESGNISEGTVVSHDAHDNIVVGEPDHVVALLGVRGLVVVQAGNKVLVMPRERAQDVREIVDRLRASDLDEFL